MNYLMLPQETKISTGY